MRDETIQYRVRIDQKTFRSFALFDTFREKKHARLPAIFCLIMAAFAVVAILSGRPQRWLIAGVLLVVGMGMPALYAGTFLLQVGKQGKALGLKTPRPAYTVTLTKDAIRIHNDLKAEADQSLEWGQIYRVIRRKGCFYLYAVPQKAFILPDRDADCAASEAIAFMRAHVPGGKLR